MSALFVLARKQTIWSLRRRGQERHSDRTAHTSYVTLLRVEISLPQGLSGLYILV